MIIRARIISLNVKTKGKGEDTERVGRIVIETEDLDLWQLDLLGEHLDGIMHKIGIDE